MDWAIEPSPQRLGTRQGQVLSANSLNMATGPVAVLKTPVEMPAGADQDKVVRALDEPVSRAWLPDV